MVITEGSHSSAIIGATTVSHLEIVVGALSVKLTQVEIQFMEEPYIPHKIIGHF